MGRGFFSYCHLWAFLKFNNNKNESWSRKIFWMLWFCLLAQKDFISVNRVLIHTIKKISCADLPYCCTMWRKFLINMVQMALLSVHCSIHGWPCSPSQEALGQGAKLNFNPGNYDGLQSLDCPTPRLLFPQTWQSRGLCWFSDLLSWLVRVAWKSKHFLQFLHGNVSMLA